MPDVASLLPGAAPVMLVLDVDGTLLDGAGDMPPGRRRALTRVSQVIPTMLATGKTWPSIAQLASEFDLAGPHLICNGAAAATAQGEIEVLAALDRAVADDVLAALHRRGVATATYLDDGTSVTDAPHHRFREIERVAEAPPTVAMIPDDAEVLKILAVLRDDEEDDLRSLHADASRIQRTGAWFLEWNAPTASKGHGLALLGERHGLDVAHMMAVGDSENDVSMFRVVGSGVAVRDASAETAAVADVHLVTEVADWFHGLAGLTRAGAGGRRPGRPA